MTNKKAQVYSLDRLLRSFILHYVTSKIYSMLPNEYTKIRAFEFYNSFDADMSVYKHIFRGIKLETPNHDRSSLCVITLLAAFPGTV